MSYKKRFGGLGALCTVAAIACLAACSDGDNGTATAQPSPAGSAAAGFPSLDDSVAGLKAAHPKARVQVQGSRIQRIYGVTGTGKSPDAAAESFRRESAALLGLGPTDLSRAAPNVTARTNGIGLMYDPATGKYKFRLFTYDQQRDGIPVFQGGLRTLVREGGDNPVVWANADLRPMGSFRPQAGVGASSVDVDKSLRALSTTSALARRTTHAPKALTNITPPTLTIFAGVGRNIVPPRTAMRYTAEAANGPGKWTFVADVATGDILHVESNLHYDINGTVEAEVILGSESAECGALGLAPLPHAEVTSATGTAFTDGSGAFTLAEAGSGPVSVASSVTGQYFDVVNNAGSTTSLSLSVTPPGPATFQHQDPALPPELVLAQLNAYKQANELRDMLLGYLPDYPIIAGQTNFPVTVNFTGLLCEQTGGAWYDDDSALRSINFCQRTDFIANSAFGSIVHHEYGHHIVDSGDSGQNEYGEGMADTISMLFTKDPRIGVGYYLDNCDEPLRRGDRDCQFDAIQCSSCGNGPYDCGALLSGTIWDIWQALDASEPSNSDDILRSLVFSSIPLHTGTSIDASIAIDMLTLDDDDELLENGTPHYVEICAGFEAHGMDCPPIVDGLVVKGADLDAEGPSNGPFEPTSVSYTLHHLGPEDTITYSVTTPADVTWLTVDSSGGTIALGEAATVTVSIDETAAALLPDGNYSATIEFVNETSGEGSVSRTARLRVGAPEPIYTATFDSGLEGFTGDTEPGNLWHQSTGCVDTQPGHSSGGSLYYGKDASCDYNTPVPIRHTITSPVITIANPALAELGFNYVLETEEDPNYDHADVLVSVDGGPFEIVASNNNGGAKLNETTAWEEARFAIWSLLPATGPVSIRIQLAFNAGDTNDNLDTGFAVDDLTVYAQPATCTSDAQCNDNLLCNGVETCVNQLCVAGDPPDCNDDNVCTVDGCNEATGCAYDPNTEPCADDGDECTFDYCDAGVCQHPDSGFCTPTNTFLEQNGTVVMEAEHFTENTSLSAHSWELRSNNNASGQSVMRSVPNNGTVINADYTTTSPELSYPVTFSTTGNYYVWIRGIGPNANDDSCHVGIDGSAISSADRITGFGTSLSWSTSTMDGPAASLQVTEPGYHDINVWMREDGFSIDKIVLTTNANFWPWGNGPGESPSDGSGQSPCAAYCENPITFSSNNYQSGNLGTGATCHETTAQLNGAVCGNFVGSRQLFVNGVAMPCNWAPWPSLPAAENGGYCIYTTSGNHPWAAFTTW